MPMRACVACVRVDRRQLVEISVCFPLMLALLFLGLRFSWDHPSGHDQLPTQPVATTDYQLPPQSQVTMVRIPGQPPRAPRKRQPLDNMLDSVESWITERNGFVVRRRAASTPQATAPHHAPARRSSSSVTTPISTALVLQILGEWYCIILIYTSLTMSHH